MKHIRKRLFSPQNMKVMLSATCLLFLVWLNISETSSFPSEFKIQDSGTAQFVNNSDYEEFSHNSSRRNSKPKNILIWTPYFGEIKPWKKVFSRLILKECPVSNCILWTKKMKLEYADAVVFNGNDLHKKKLQFLERPIAMPSSELRKSNQVYVFMTFEAPTKFTNVKLKEYDNYFNWTMTYRRDSEIYAPYGIFHPKNISEHMTVSEEDMRSKKMVAWMASNCNTSSKRETIVDELRKYVAVDIYGACGTLKCGHQTTLPNMVDQTGDSDPCDKIIENYKFYLAFENSICEDYVSEKFFRALKHGAIPIVLGGANYTALAPPNSFIDAKVFDTVKDLALYMIEVSSSVTLMNKHLDWRNHFTVELGHPYKPLICDLCRKLHEEDINTSPHYYKSIYDWYIAGSHCYSVSL